MAMAIKRIFIINFVQFENTQDAKLHEKNTTENKKNIKKTLKRKIYGA